MPRHAKPQKIGKGRRKARSCDSSDWKVQNGLEAEAEVPSLLEETVLLQPGNSKTIQRVGEECLQGLGDHARLDRNWADFVARKRFRKVPNF